MGEETQTITYDTNGNGTFDAADLARVLTRQYADAVMTARNSGYTLAPAGAGAAVEASAIYGFEPVAGRLQSVTAGSELGSALSSYVYEPARPHLIKTVTSPTHVVTNTWEPNRDVLDIKENKQGATNRSTYNYTVNPVGQRTAVQTTGYTGGSWNWEYDNLGQVKKADNTTLNSIGTSADRAYLYDDIGNRKNAQDGIIAIPSGTPPTYTANSLNQYTAINASVPGYDFAGNMTSDGGANGTNTSRSYLWDAEQRLKEVKNTASPQTVIATYRYDAFHRRISKTVGTTTTWFIYDGWNLIAEYTSSSGSSPVLNKLHHWGLDLSGTFQGAGGVGGLLATDLLDTSVVGLSARYYPTYDGNGNVSEYLRGTLPSVPRFIYDSFGRIIVPSTNSWAPHLSFRFSTKYRDEETEFYYYGYRYLSTTLGRWINRDPIEERGGLNLYGVVGNDLLNSVDPRGLDVLVIVGGPISSPGGHIALGIQNDGIYSWGTAHKDGSSVQDYLTGQSKLREQQVFRIKTTEGQDKLVKDAFMKARARGYSIVNGDTCATAVSEGLVAIGVLKNSSLFPNVVAARLSYRMQQNENIKGIGIFQGDVDFNDPFLNPFMEGFR